MNDPIVFLRLQEKDAASDLTAALDRAGLPWKVDRMRQSFDPFYRFRAEYAPYALMVQAADLPAVRAVEEALHAGSAGALETDHYLLQMDTDELREVVEKEDEWSRRDVLTAVQLLHDKGVSITEQDRQHFRSIRLLESRRPDRLPVFALVLGIATVAFGILLDYRAHLLGIALGLHLELAKGRDLEGKSDFYRYNNNARVFGGIVLIVCSCYFLVMLWDHLRLVKSMFFS